MGNKFRIAQVCYNYTEYPMDSITTRRLPIRRGRRIPVSVSLAAETHELLVKIGEGNKSAAIEELARLYRRRELAIPRTEPVT